MRRRRMGRWAVALLAGTLLVGVILERQARATAAELWLDTPMWYPAAAARVAHEPVDVIVVGSSRVAMAVVEDRLAERLSARTRRRTRVIDLGLGYSTWVEHALGLQRLIDAGGDHLRGAVLLIEAPSGRPPLGSWAQWYHPFSPGLLRMVLRSSDLGPLWRSPEAFGRKVSATLELIGSDSALIRHRRRLRDHAVARVAARVFGDPAPPTTGTGAGGMKPGALNLQNVRLRTVLQGIGLGQTAAPGDPAPTETLVRTARRAGLTPVLVFVPEYPDRWDFGGYADALHQRGRGRLGDVALLRPDLSPAPSDFPDGVHLSDKAAAAYTDALAAVLPLDSR